MQWFFSKGCPLVILACNTASAKALRTIQQNDLPEWPRPTRVLGVIRPTAEVIGTYSNTGQIGVLATPGNCELGILSDRDRQVFPALKVFQQSCPMWVPLIENNEHLSPGRRLFLSEMCGSAFGAIGPHRYYPACLYPLSAVAEKISRQPEKTSGWSARTISWQKAWPTTCNGILKLSGGCRKTGKGAFLPQTPRRILTVMQEHFSAKKSRARKSR